MIRLFNTHNIRKTYELDGMWNFETKKLHNITLPVPGCWEQHPQLHTYRGVGTYTKSVYVHNTTAIRLEFKGVGHTCDVYFDEKHVAHHYNAFTPFDAVIPAVSKGWHEIKVIADNSFGPESALHIPNDYYSYGGITRPVCMEEISDVYIKGIRFTPEFKNGIWNAEIAVTLTNLTGLVKNVSLKCKLCGVELNFENIEVTDEKTVCISAEFPEAKAWDIKTPELYYLQTELYSDGEVCDDLIERVGFRTVDVCENKIYLNGKKIFIQGFNLHEDIATIGSAIPLQLMALDIDLMTDMGANAVRTSHYPNDERFLDLCDERGLLVWEESHARGLYMDDMNNPNFDSQSEVCINEMIFNHYNHASIFVWGIMNECESSMEEGRVKYKKQFEQVRELDKSRPTTFATCRHYNDICLDLPDIMSVNIYSGWYSNDDISSSAEKEIEWMKSVGGNKPVIISEFGGGAIYGNRDVNHPKWSEERQCDIIDECLKAYMNSENVSGVFIWQFADCRVSDERDWWFMRPGTRNNKGIVDIYRRPKLAYEVVKRHFTSNFKNTY